jgi:hypothetical protein
VTITRADGSVEVEPARVAGIHKMVKDPEWFAVPGKDFMAKFSSPCGLCKRRIHHGDIIHYVAKGVVAHVECQLPSRTKPAVSGKPDSSVAEPSRKGTVPRRLQREVAPYGEHCDPVLGPDDDGGWVERVAELEFAEDEKSFGRWARSL